MALAIVISRILTDVDRKRILAWLEPNPCELLRPTVSGDVGHTSGKYFNLTINTLIEASSCVQLSHLSPCEVKYVNPQTNGSTSATFIGAHIHIFRCLPRLCSPWADVRSNRQ